MVDIPTTDAQALCLGRAGERSKLDDAQDLNTELFRTRDQLKIALMTVGEQAGRLADLDRQVFELRKQQTDLHHVRSAAEPGAGTSATQSGYPSSRQPLVAIENIHSAHGQNNFPWQHELDIARKRYDAVARMLGEVLDSRSWKLTRPLRQLTELLRGRRWVEPLVEDAPSADNQATSTPIQIPLLDPMAAIADLAFEIWEAPRISIIVPAYGNLVMTVQCLRSISEHPPGVPYEVIVVEDCSGDPDIGALMEVPGLVYHENSSNLGFLLSCNAAADLARGEFVCFLNNDTEVEDGWADALLKVFENFAECGLVGAKLLFPDGRLQEAGGIIWADGSGWNHGRGGDSNAPEFNYVREVDYCSGAAIMVRTEVFKELGRFDPRYAPAYYEDADLAFRLREHGLKAFYCPTAVVTHHEGMSHGTSTSTGIKAFQVRNQKVFRERWRHVLDRRHYHSGDCVFRAREHARHKQVVLVMDHTIPQPDRDAGSRAMLQTMVRLTHMGLAVKFWPNDHIYQSKFLPMLEDAGIEVLTGERWDGNFEGFVRELGHELDFAVLSRPNFAGPYLTKLREYSRARVVLFGHDIHHLRMLGQAEVTGDRAAHSAALEMKVLEQSLWRDVDSIIYPSREEADVVVDHVGPGKVHAVPLYCFEEHELTLPEVEQGVVKILFVAGFGHPPNEDAAVWLVTEILPLIVREVPNAVLYLVGSNPTARVSALATNEIKVFPNVHADELRAHYLSASVAVAPLRFGGGVKLKVVEAMANGVPMVTTSIGVQGLPCIEDCIGVADDAQSVATTVVALINDRVRASSLVSSAHDYLRENYSTQCMERALWRALLDKESLAGHTLSVDRPFQLTN